MDPTDPFVQALWHTESAGNPTAQTGSYRGLSQMNRSEETQYGINDSNYQDPALQAHAVTGIDARNTNSLRHDLGYEPTPGDRYVAWQQGPSGAAALAQGGSTPAWQTIRQYYPSDHMAQKAISGNPFMKGMDPNISAANFYTGWKNKFENTYNNFAGNGAALSGVGPGALDNQQPTQQQQQQGGGQMPDNSAGALSPASMGGGGALSPPPSGLTGPGGVGNTLQNIAAWLNMPSNPGGTSALLGQVNADRDRQNQMALQLRLALKPQPYDMGNDLLGQKRMPMLWDPMSQTMRPMTIQGSQVTGGGGGVPQQGSPSYAPDGTGFTQAFNDFKAGKIGAQQLHDAAPAMVQQEAESILAGNTNPNNLGARNQGLRAGGILLAQAMEPGFNQTTIPAREQANKALISQQQGTLGGTITNAQAVAAHAASYMDGARALQKLQYLNGAYNDVNWAQNLIKSHSGDENFKSIVKGMNVDADYLAGEAVKSATGAQGAYADRQAIRQTLDVNASLPEKQRAVAAVFDAMHGRAAGAVNNYNEAFQLTGTPKERTLEGFLGQAANNNMQRALAADDPQQAGGGPTASASQQAFTGRTATNPKTGARLRETSDGNWVP